MRMECWTDPKNLDLVLVSVELVVLALDHSVPLVQKVFSSVSLLLLLREQRLREGGRRVFSISSYAMEPI